MSKVSIVFHSVCGNCYLIAREFYKEFQKLNAEVEILRVNDPNFDSLSKQFTIAGQYKNEVLNIEIAEVDKLYDSDIIIMGSPTYFGNVSGAMKAFMDTFYPGWPNSKFWGKKLLAYTTSSNVGSGGDSCLNTINNFGKQLGMLTVPVPINLVSGQRMSPYGLIHYVGDYSNMRPSGMTIAAIREMAERLIHM